MTEWIVTSTVLTALVILMRYALRGRIGLRLQYGLWLLVLVRLLLPVSFGTSPISAANGAERIQQAQTDWVHMAADAVADRETVAVDLETYPMQPVNTADVPPASLSQNTPQQPEHFHLSQLWKGSTVWIGGVAVMGPWFLGTNLRFARRLRRSRQPLTVEDCPLPVYETAAVETPCLFGLLRPAVYLTPEAAADETTLRYAVAHEATHYHHKDHIWAVLRCAALALHWYNPLVWWAAILSRRDGELACDEATVARLGEDQRAAYGRTLITMSCEKPNRLLVTATTMNDGTKGLKERIQLLARRPKTTLGIALLVVLAAAAAVGCTFTGADQPAESPTEATQNAEIKEEPDPAPEQPVQLPEETAETTPLPEEKVAELAEQLKGDPQFLLHLKGYDPEWNNAISFGDGWVDDDGRAHLEFRAGCLWPSMLMEAVLEETGETWSLVSVGQAPGQWVSEAPEGTAMSEAELARWNNWLWTDPRERTAIRRQFLTSLYRSPEEIDLSQLFYNGCADGGRTNAQWVEPSSAEVEEVMGGPVHISCSKVTTAEMELCLQTYLGLDMEDVSGYLLEEFIYSPKYDAYYHIHGDTNSADFGTAQAGWTMSDGSVRLRYPTYRFRPEDFNEVALAPDGDGGWRFLYNLPVREKDPAVSDGSEELAAVLEQLEKGPVRMALLIDIGVMADFFVPDTINSANRAADLATQTYVPVALCEKSGVRINIIPVSETADWQLTYYDDSDYMTLTVGENKWAFLAEDNTGQLRAGDIAKMWYDEAESGGFYDTQDTIVIPNEGQDYLAAAQSFCETLEGKHLNVSNGSCYKFTFVQCTVRAAEEMTQLRREQGRIGENTWAFGLTTVFVPENEEAWNMAMAGNTGAYEGDDPAVPEDAWEYGRCGYITLEEDGWHGELVGTSW